MKKFIFITSISFVLFYSACEFGRKESTTPLIDSKKLFQLIISALDSSDTKNNPLDILFGKAKDKSFAYNKIVIDSIVVGKRKHYSILLEHPIPAYNLFAVIDDSLNLVLKDVSLNGYIRADWKTINNKTCIEIKDEFKSYEVYNLHRYSLYFPDENQYSLVFRTFTFFGSPQDSVYQSIVDVTDSLISTKIPKPKFLSITDSIDYFIFDKTKRRYISNKNLFDSLILKEINNTQNELTPNHILNKKSINDILEYPTEDQIFITDENDFRIDVSEEWTKIYNVSLSRELNRKVKGIYFVNQKLGATIGIIKISLTDSAEIYVNEKLTVLREIGNYRVKQSELKQDLKKFYQTIEHNCGNKKYLLLIEGSKSLLKENQNLFNNILSSFRINC